MTPRRNDPWTSWAARLSIDDVQPSQAAVLHVLHTDDVAKTLEQIVLAVRDVGNTKGWPRFTESRIRTAVKELMQHDPPLVFDTGHTARTRSGRVARLLQLTAAVPA